jgi:hypothetical protein
MNRFFEQNNFGQIFPGENVIVIVKQLDSLSTSERLEPNVSNECISKVGACLYTN